MHLMSVKPYKAYTTRTIFFLTPSDTLKPIAIELSLPRALPGSQPKRVLTPPIDATWKWQLAKAHVCSNDAGVHQLSHHWYADENELVNMLTNLYSFMLGPFLYWSHCSHICHLTCVGYEHMQPWNHLYYMHIGNWVRCTQYIRFWTHTWDIL